MNKTIALFPGGFKPPHKGHFEAFKHMLKNADEGMVIIGKSERDGITAQMAEDVWKVYERFISKPITIVIAPVSPIKTVYEWTDLNKDKYKEIHVGSGIEDQKRWAFFVKNKDSFPNVKIVEIPPQFGRISGTATRQNIGDIEKWIPEEVLRNKTATDSIKKSLLIMKESVILEFLFSPKSNKFLQEASFLSTSGGDVDDGPRFMYGDLKTYKKVSQEHAKRIGYQVVNYIIPDQEFEKHDTDYPKGPPEAVSYFPSGVPGLKNSGTNYAKDLKAHPAYQAWKTHINKLATSAGYSIVDYLEAEESKSTGMNEVKNGISWQEIVKELVKEEKKSNVNLLLEGGAAGHLNHPYDRKDLTFGDLKRIIVGALQGKLDFEKAPQEKCISGDSLIEVRDVGRIPIASVVDDKIGDYVLGYDEELHREVWLPIIERFNNGNTEDWVEIELENGHKIQVTGNHRIYTSNRGYVKAEDLSLEDDIVVRSDGK